MTNSRNRTPVGSCRYWAIREKDTGDFLPAGLHRNTQAEPQPAKSAPPRLFKSPHDAQVALTWWLKGVTYLIGAEDWEDNMSTRRIPNRSADKMEIVELSLVEAP